MWTHGRIKIIICKIGYFLKLDEGINWIQNFFSEVNFQTAQLNVAQKESLIDVSADRALKSAFKENPLINFWLVLKNEYMNNCLTWQWGF